MNRLSDWIYQKTTSWVALIFLVIFLLFTAFILPTQNEKAKSYAGEAGSPDTSFFYTAENLYQFAEQYGPGGRSAYIKARLIFDTIFPLVYGSFLTTAISWTFKLCTPKGSPWRLMNLVPLLGVLFDYLENITAAIVMARYPSKTPILAQMAGIFTSIKWVFVTASFLLLIFGIIRAKGRLFRQQKTPENRRDSFL